MTELAVKLKTLRESMARHGLEALRLRGVDWFSWITCGGSNWVILTTETGIAEVFVTQKNAWILTNSIESKRLKFEELPKGFEIIAPVWSDSVTIEKFVSEQIPERKRIASDRPQKGEVGIPADILSAKRQLLSVEIERYRELGKSAASAMTDTLLMAKPEFSERQLAGELARLCWQKGIEPTLILVGGESRVEQFRHPLPTEAKLGRRAMLVLCGRKHGLYANLTRWIYFTSPTPYERQVSERVARVEAAAFKASRPEVKLSDIFKNIVSAYAENDLAGEELNHHQGGTTGYLSREEFAREENQTELSTNTALAWNPSAVGNKIEDTVLLTELSAPAPDLEKIQIEILTVDPRWPSFEIEGRRRPDLGYFK